MNKKKFIGGIIGALLILGTFIVFYFKEEITGMWAALGFSTINISERIAEGDSPFVLPLASELTMIAEGFDNPRDIVESPTGDLIVASTNSGEIVLLSKESSYVKKVLVEGLERPHSVVFDPCETDCFMFVAESNAVSKYAYDKSNNTVGSREQLVALSDDGRHYTKTLLFNPTNSNQLLVSIGSSCDTCIEENLTRGTIQMLDLAKLDEGLQPFAVGLRNAVFLATHPQTQDIWVTEMGRDFLGDNLPPDEVNVINPQLGEKVPDYGWPQCYGQNVHDTTFDKDLYPRIEGQSICGDIMGKVASHFDVPSHSAPLGLTFIPADSAWPDDWEGDLLVAYHGSWNRTVPAGYKVVRLELDSNNQVVTEHEFISGWLEGSESFGRPADVLFIGDDLFISDDKAGVVYRVTPQ